NAMNRLQIIIQSASDSSKTSRISCPLLIAEPGLFKAASNGLGFGVCGAHTIDSSGHTVDPVATLNRGWATAGLSCLTNGKMCDIIGTVRRERKGRVVAMASIRKRTWQSGSEEKTAWIADYFDQQEKRHIKTFPTKKAADAWLITTR